MTKPKQKTGSHHHSPNFPLLLNFVNTFTLYSSQRHTARLFAAQRSSFRVPALQTWPPHPRSIGLDRGREEGRLARLRTWRGFEPTLARERQLGTLGGTGDIAETRCWLSLFTDELAVSREGVG